MTNPAINASSKELKKFCLMFSAICVAVGAYSWYHAGHAWPWLAGGAAFFLATGLFIHPVLRPVFIVWMKFAHVLGWINTRILLGVFFYIILTPAGLVMRLFGKDPMERKLDRAVQSYWIIRKPEPFDPKRYEQVF